MHVALCVIATGKYQRFLRPWLESAHAYLLPKHDRRWFVFADSDSQISNLESQISWVPTPHRPWPGPTLYRYHTLLQAADQLAACDYVFYCDVDMRCLATIGDEILGRLTAVIHPGFSGQPRTAWSYETRPASRACILPHEGRHYYAGGFQGGSADAYLAACRTLAAAVDADAAAGITAVWHDESHWNRYLIDHPPEIELSPLYCSPDSWHVPGRKLVALDKNHAEVRA